MLSTIFLSEKRGDSNATSEPKQCSNSESIVAQKTHNVAPPPGFRDTTDVKDGKTVKPVVPGQLGDVEPPPGFKGEAPQASKGSKRRAEESEEAHAKRVKSRPRCCSLIFIVAYCCVQ